MHGRSDGRSAWVPDFAGRLSSTANEIHLALLSDTHIGGDRERAKDPRGGFDPWENLHRVVPDVRNHHVLVIEESFLRFIVLDSLFYVAKAAGLLGAHQRWWLTVISNRI